MDDIDSLFDIPLDITISREQGLRGPRGRAGKDGKDGEDGKDGVDGENGKDGINGKDGKNGRDGIDGIDGESIKGDKGDDGLSAYEIWLQDEDNEGTEEDFLKSLKGKDGKTPQYHGNAYTELREQEDVSIAVPTEGDVLAYDAPTKKWTNGTYNFNDYVPYTGALQDVDLGTFDLAAANLSADTLQYTIDLVAPAIHSEGLTFYDGDEKAFAYMTNVSGVTIHPGHEEVIYGTNKTGVTLTTGQVVYVNGAQGGRPTFALADASVEATSDTTIGLIKADIAHNATGFVITSGVIENVDTNTFAEGDQVYLSATAGEFTNIPPESPDHLIRLGDVIRVSATEGKILISINIGDEMIDIHDVYYPDTPQNFDYLRYNSSNSLWENTRGQDLSTTATPTFAGFSDSTFTIFNNTDNTKKLQLLLSGITTATTRTLTAPDNNGVITTVNNILGTTNQITVTDGGDTATLSTPQDIHTGASPTFAGATFTDDVTQSQSAISANNVLTVYNTDNTSGTSNSYAWIRAGGASGGDPSVALNIQGINNFSLGVDNSDDDAFKMDTSLTVGANTVYKMDRDGVRTLPSQPSFIARRSGDAANVTGDGTAYAVIAGTIIATRNSPYNGTTGIYTAHETGLHRLTINIRITGLTSSHTSGSLTVVTSNRNYRVWESDPYATSDAGDLVINGTVLADMDAADTAYFNLIISGGTKVVTVYGGADAYTSISGQLEV